MIKKILGYSLALATILVEYKHYWSNYYLYLRKLL
ncbi:hypothetical protein KNT57_gp001 [Shigella phage KNP5]|nr:hypothetical protein KNT57_gp001 [Shigella phage KNP5]